MAGWMVHYLYHVSLNQVSVDGTHPVIYVEKLYEKGKVHLNNVFIQYMYNVG